MTWTSEPPTESGWYWARVPNYPAFVLYFNEGHYLINSTWTTLNDINNFEFYGPLEVPE